MHFINLIHYNKKSKTSYMLCSDSFFKVSFLISHFNRNHPVISIFSSNPFCTTDLWATYWIWNKSSKCILKVFHITLMPAWVHDQSSYIRLSWPSWFLLKVGCNCSRLCQLLERHIWGGINALKLHPCDLYDASIADWSRVLRKQVERSM